MPKVFDINVPAYTTALDGSNSAEVVFTVTNVSAHPLRARLLATPNLPNAAPWFTILEGTEQRFDAAEARSVTVKIVVPPGAQGGRYTFRLDAYDLALPDDTLQEGPSVAFSVVPQPGSVPWWAWVPFIVAALAVIGFVVYTYVTRVPPTRVQVAFISSREFSSAVYLMNQDGTEKQAIVFRDGELPLNPAHPAWSHDGKLLAFDADCKQIAPTAIPSPTQTLTPPPISPPPLKTATRTPSPTVVPPTATVTPTRTSSATSTGTITPTNTPQFTSTPTPVPSATPTATLTITPSPVPTLTSTATDTPAPQVIVVPAIGSSLCGSGKRQLYVWNSVGYSPAFPTALRNPFLSDNNDSEPAWSPFGDTLVFTSDQSGNEDIWKIPSEGQLFRRNLTQSNAGRDIDPAFSPKGDLIAFASVRPETNGKLQLYVMDIDGGHIKRLLTTVGDDSKPVWSPAGDRIAFVEDLNNKRQIYVLDLTGIDLNNPGTLKPQLVSDQTATDDFPAWSPDGQRIIFSSMGRTDTPNATVAQIYVMGKGGEAVTNVSLNPSISEIQPVWQPVLAGKAVTSTATTSPSPVKSATAAATTAK